ncbi:MAG: hypothetical protein DA446_09035 [Bacteroidetes bacterium]|nr:MAG: hypothetical protein DA446_09035 [Bacteroidota bacterium]
MIHIRALLGITLFGWLLNLFLPWWAVLIPALAFSIWFIESARTALLTGFLGGAIAWFAQALFTHFLNDGILTTRIAELFGLGNPWLLLFLFFVMGGLIGLAGSITGYQLKRSLKPA